MFPIKYIDNNLVWNKDNEVFAYYELIPYNYSFLSAEQKFIVHDSFRQLIAQSREGKIHALQIATESSIRSMQEQSKNADLNTFLERMTAMVDAEWQARADKRFNRLMKEAHLRYPAADLDETIYRPERQLDTQTIERLSTCHWIEEGKNLIVTGSSASGKTYLINAFCVTAMKQSKSVKYIKANTLMSEMEQARIKSTNLDYLNKLTKLDLLVIDDFGLMDLDLDKCRDLFEVLDTRDGRKSTVVISQFPVSTWFDMFADNTYADACLTRITDKHHTYRLEMNGINMRETE